MFNERYKKQRSEADDVRRQNEPNSTPMTAACSESRLHGRFDPTFLDHFGDDFARVHTGTQRRGRSNRYQQSNCDEHEVIEEATGWPVFTYLRNSWLWGRHARRLRQTFRHQTPHHE